MRAFADGSQAFQSDQTLVHSVTYYDTPFTVLHNGIASNGLILDVREPLPTDNWKSYYDTLNALGGSNTAASTAFASVGRALVSDGRADCIQDYWAGGAPSEWGVTQNGRVAVHFQAIMRSVQGRSWFSSDTAPTLFLAAAGEGLMRIEAVISGTRTQIFHGILSEKSFLALGFGLSAEVALAEGDSLDIYYVQGAKEIWGGFVVKAVLGSKDSDDSVNQANAAAAWPISCGLMDDGTPPTPVTLHTYETIDTVRTKQAASTASVVVPLINTQMSDGSGWEWSDPTLTLKDADTTVATLERKRLIQIAMGVGEENLEVFTGFIDDFDDSEQGQVTIACLGFETRLIEQFDKQYPDRISYMGRGYRSLLGATEPVYPVPAFDNWPMEWAISEMLVRRGIDPAQLTAPRVVPLSDGTEVTVTYGTETFSKFRAKSITGKHIRLERPVHYGNSGVAFSELKPVDDKYVFRVEASKEVWNRVREITDRYGYEFHFDEVGAAVLEPRQNPCQVYDVTASDGGGTEEVHPAAFDATYMQYTGSATVTKTGLIGARFDVCFPRGVGLGSWQVTVHSVALGIDVATVVVDPSASESAQFYDTRWTLNGTNTTLVTVYSGDFGEYTITLTSSGGTGATVRQLDCIFAYHTDALLPKYPAAFDTAVNAFSVQAKSDMENVRNRVTIVGRRKAAVTDSTKLNDNPENPEDEFIVARAVDQASIADPTAPNYIGYEKEAVIYNSDITDQAYANYLAQVFLYRYRIPKAAAPVSHSLIPHVQLNDPIFCNEDTYQTITPTDVRFVTSIKHHLELTQGTTSLETTPYPEFAAYEPREDIDLTRFNGNPVINVVLSYTALTGQVETNRKDGVVESLSVDYGNTLLAPITDSRSNDFVQLPPVSVASDALGDYLQLPSDAPWPPIPGTVQVRPSLAVLNSLFDSLPEVTTVSETFFTAPGSRLPTVVLPSGARIIKVELRYGFTSLGFGGSRITLGQDSTQDYWYEVKDGTVFSYHSGESANDTFGDATIYVTWKEPAKGMIWQWFANNPWHHYTEVDYRTSQKRIYLPWQEGDTLSHYSRNTDITAYDVRYRRLGKGDENNSFTDPYAGASPFYDPYTSELGYLVNFQFDALVSGNYRIAVRSLSDDTVVAYLTSPTADPDNPEMHWDYVEAGINKTYSWDGVDNRGEWNTRQSTAYAAAATGSFGEDKQQPIGKGFYCWNQEVSGSDFGRLALISGDLDATGKPIFGQGTFATWYLAIEVVSDTVQATVSTAALDSEFNTNDAAFVFTHLPKAPTRARLKITDWNSGTFSPSMSQAAMDAGFGGATPDSNASINNAKPVRIRIQVEPRPGVLWEGLEDQVSIKLFRSAHLRAHIMDQFITFTGLNYPGSTTEQRTIGNRRLVNDSHTLEYKDDGYRLANSLRWEDADQGAEWIFYPELFRKEFEQAGVTESIQFGNYLQLEEVPNWSDGKTPAGNHARLQFAFLSYLFYLSVYTQDRSGRYCWAMNRSFVDQSKITTNAANDWWVSPQTPANATNYQTDWPDDPNLQHRRTVVVRQWLDEPGWVAAQRSTFGFGAGDIGYYLVDKHRWANHDPQSTTIGSASWSSFTLGQDYYSAWHATWGDRVSSGDPYVPTLPAQWLNLDRVLTSLGGTWTWETDPSWAPCISRDFHGYYLLPPMPDRPVVEVSTPYDIFPSATQEVSYGKYAPAPYIYLQVDYREYNTEDGKNEGDDIAAGDTWSSPVRDNTEGNLLTETSGVRFWPGTKVDSKAYPTGADYWGITGNTLDYVRQDELVHYEDLRGMFSRGPRPQEQPIKVVPVQPYYINWYDYDYLHADRARRNAQYPKFRAYVLRWWEVKFRSEYYWESGSMFPVTDTGVELQSAMNISLTRFQEVASLARVRYDSGAWVGWKDDKRAGDGENTLFTGFAYGQIGGGTPAYAGVDGKPATRYFTPFENSRLPAGVGPRLPQTVDLYFQLVLVPARRGSLG
jgi:hypothetical protein